MNTRGAAWVLMAAALLTALPLPGCRHRRPPEEPKPTRPYPGVKNRPYTLRGRYFRPMSIPEALHYRERGQASFYEAHGNATATGERPKSSSFYAAHRTLPLPCVVRVTNHSNGKSCLVRVCDRGPFHMNRIIDVSRSVAHELNFVRAGVHEVEIEVVSVGDGPYRRTPDDAD